MNGALRHPGPPPSSSPDAPIVAFDFDGTLTCRDSFIAFLAWRRGRAQFIVGGLQLVPALASYAVTRDRDALGIATAKHFLGGLERGVIEREARDFHDSQFDQLMRPTALVCWRDWRQRGARLYIVTAAPEILVAPFAQTLGADGLIGSRLAFDERDRFTGQRGGPHCRGPEKVARLRAQLGDGIRLAAAYGDTSGDREMLDFAETPGYRVFGDRP